MGTIQGQEQNKGGVNIAWERMQSRELAHVRSATTRGPRCCLSQDICWGVSCHPSRLCSALDGPLCRGVSYVTKLLYLEPHAPCVDFIIVRLKEIIPKFYPYSILLFLMVLPKAAT